MKLTKDMNIEDIMTRAKEVLIEFDDGTIQDLSSFRIIFNEEEMILESYDYTEEFKVPLDY